MRTLTVVVVVLAVLVVGFFAAVNFYPVAPTRARGPRRQVVVALEAGESKWLSENLIAEFNVEHNTDLAITTVDEAQVGAALEAPAPDVLAVSLPRTLAVRASKHAAVRSFTDVAPASELAADFSDLRTQALEAAQVDGRQVFLPGYTLLDLMVYRQSRVRDAVRHWSLLRRDIEAALRTHNGHGLPPGYSLELEPELWDGYDRFVIGYYWAHRIYGGEPVHGRIAHRTGEHLDALWDLTEGLSRAGADDASLKNIDSPAARDFFAWESLYHDEKLFHPAMFERPLDDEAILDLVGGGELYLATVDQLDAFRLHGGSHVGTPPRIADADDLAFAPMPRMSSLEVDNAGHPARPGKAFSLRQDWVWALPAHGPDPRLALELVKFLWQRDNHLRACEALGMLPLRNDIVRERSSLFRLVWMDDVFDAVFAELDHSRPLPDIVGDGIGSTYAQLWDRIVAQREARTPDAIAALLGHPPPPRPLAPTPPPPVKPPTEASDDDVASPDDDDLWRGKVTLDVGRPAAPAARTASAVTGGGQ